MNENAWYKYVKRGTRPLSLENWPELRGPPGHHVNFYCKSKIVVATKSVLSWIAFSVAQNLYDCMIQL